MTLDEAIKHCEEVAEYKEAVCKTMENEEGEFTDSGNTYYKYCKRRASEYRQLAEWLRELQQRRKYENGCQYCKYKFRSDEDEPCIICSHNYTDKFKDDGTREVNADADSD